MKTQERTIVTAYFLDALATDRKNGAEVDRVDAVEDALQNLAEHLDLEFRHESEIDELADEMREVFDEARLVEAAMAKRLFEKDPSFLDREFRTSGGLAKLEAEENAKPSKWVDENGNPTAAGAKAMFAAIDETK